MSFDISLQINSSERERLNKNVTDVLVVNGDLKRETSIIKPVILIECDLSQVSNVNYMTIPAFNRKYFVDNIKSVRNGLVEFSCRVDVLSTYAEAIKANSAILHRQQNKWNLYLNDGSFRVYQNSFVITKEFPQGFSTQEFVLAVAGG